MDDVMWERIRAELQPMLAAVEAQRGKPTEDELLIALLATEADRRRRTMRPFEERHAIWRALMAD